MPLIKSRPSPEGVPMSLTIRYTLLALPPIAVLRLRYRSDNSEVGLRCCVGGAYRECLGVGGQLERSAPDLEGKGRERSELSGGQTQQTGRVVHNTPRSSLILGEGICRKP